jgi:hypothetical protein
MEISPCLFTISQNSLFERIRRLQQNRTALKAFLIRDLVVNCLTIATGGYEPRLLEQAEVLGNILQGTASPLGNLIYRKFSFRDDPQDHYPACIAEDPAPGGLSFCKIEHGCIHLQE